MDSVSSEGILFYISFFSLFNKVYKTQKKMDEGIRRLNKELSDLNAHLENMVEERTKALKRSHENDKKLILISLISSILILFPADTRKASAADDLNCILCHKFIGLSRIDES